MPIIIPSTFTPPPTSGTYIFTVTRDDIIRQAMLGIGKLDEDEVPSARATTDCAMMLNMMVKQWQGKADFAPGLKTWTRRRGYLFLSNTTGQYLAGPGAIGWTNSPILTATTSAVVALGTTLAVASGLNILAGYYIGVELDSGALFWTTAVSYSGTTLILTTGLPSGSGSTSQVYAYQAAGTQPEVIETALLRDQTLNDVPLRIIRDVQSYDLLPQKANPLNVSDPGAIYPEFQLGNSNIFTDVGAAQDVTKYIVMTYLEAIQDFNNPLDTPEYPQVWFLPLCLGLGKLICPMFNAVWTPLMQENFTTALAIAQRKEPEIRMDYFQCGEEA